MNIMTRAPTYIRRETVRACPVHTAIKDTAAAMLIDKGFFSKEQVLEETGMVAMAESIRWDYIREFIEGEYMCEMVPLAEAYFKRHKKEEELNAPEKFLAQGHGKKTKGYAAVTSANDHLIICRIKYRAAIANGTVKATQNYILAISEQRKRLGLSPLPAIAPPVDGAGT